MQNSRGQDQAQPLTSSTQTRQLDLELLVVGNVWLSERGYLSGTGCGLNVLTRTASIR